MNDVTEMAQKLLPETLERIGLKSEEVEIYLLLIKNGSQKGSNIAKILKINRRQLYRSLKILQNKGMVKAISKSPAQFSAVSFDKVLDVFIRMNKAEANRIEQYKEELLSKWRALILDQP